MGGGCAGGSVFFLYLLARTDFFRLLSLSGQNCGTTAQGRSGPCGAIVFTLHPPRLSMSVFYTSYMLYIPLVPTVLAEQYQTQDRAMRVPMVASSRR